MASNVSSVTLLSSSSQAGVRSNSTATVYFLATSVTAQYYPKIPSEFAFIQPYTTDNPVTVSFATVNGSDIVVDYQYYSPSYGVVAFATRVPVSILAAKG